MKINEAISNTDLKILTDIRSSKYTFQEYESIPVWKVFANFRCPLIGSCLTIEEQRKILKKTEGLKKGASEFDAHHTLMEFAGSENPVSLKIDRNIKNKYKVSIQKYKTLKESELETLWSDTMHTGEMAGLFYVIATRKDVSMYLKTKAFGDIHMMGHSNMYDIMKAKKSLQIEKNGNQILSDRLEDEKEKSRELKKTFKKQTRRIKELEKSENKLKKKLEEYENNNNRSELYNKENFEGKLYSIQGKNEALIKENQALLREKRKLEINYFDIESTCKILKEDLIDLINQKNVNVKPECIPGACPSCETCPKKVLMVGGMTKMKPFYRDIVEADGNEFVYHDGYIKNRTKQLNELVSASDLVLCPVNCNSHNACLRIKKLCKKHSKPYKMMPSSSLSAVSKAVTTGEAV